jgi:ArsR family transcriptional regulator, arsenate/arsenite/antimonite-responsive transcriptional repressor
MESSRARFAADLDRTAAYADMFAALGAEPRLRILRTLLAAHPDGIVVREIQNELGIAASTLSHHLEKLKNEDLITVRRESTFLRYTANTAVLEELLRFLYAECCTRNKAIKPGKIAKIFKDRCAPACCS